jgi:hypothetical protein
MQVVPAGSRLRLAPHVRACRSDGQVILLDLRRGKYLGIGRHQANALIEHIDDWPRDADDPRPPAEATASEGLKQHLLSRGLLVPASSTAGHLPVIPESTSSLQIDRQATSPAITTLHFARLLRCAGATAMQMRCRSLHAIATTVAARRERHEVMGTAPGSPHALPHAVATYERLRPLVLTARDRCVHDSLTLLAFLASEGLFPRWVIGVRTAPFGAHSWVQSGGMVLNDLHEHVRRYRPILVV